MPPRASHPASLELGLIGNCQVASLIDAEGTHVWTCMPRLDGDPVFADLLAGSAAGSAGRWSIEMIDRVAASQSYERNTAILQTILDDATGARLSITDFCPRFREYHRTFRPAALVRIVRPLAGRPRVRIVLEPMQGYAARARRPVAGSHHARYPGEELDLRLTTDAGVTAILERQIFVLDRPMSFIFGPDQSVHESVPALAQRMLEGTRGYWHDWVRGLAVPFEWQEPVIRAAICLKLCSFEDTGAIVAAITTSIPESPGSGRNWDYRYCWIRDAYFTLQALNRLGATRTMEGYLRFVQNLTAVGPLDLQPCYGIDGAKRLEERHLTHLRGYRDMGPVRIGNAAYRQSQLDVYGASILATTQSFFDQRLVQPGTAALFGALEPLGEQAAAACGREDAGIWEFRGHVARHTFSAAMCWAGVDRLARIAECLRLSSRQQYWRQLADGMQRRIIRSAWSQSLGSFTSTFDGDAVDASLLLLAELGLVDWRDPRYAATVERIGRTLRRGKFLARYVEPDDFGRPASAFTVCMFWYVNALWASGEKQHARELFEHMLSCRNHLGLLSEDLAPESCEPWGNYPQTYSMVGIINCAMRLSRSWEDAL